MRFIACLPWYDFSELQPHNDELWQRIARGLRERGLDGVPGDLDRATPYTEQWSSRGLLLGQACGYDALLTQRHQLRIVATPCFGFAGCTGSNYSSVVVVRKSSSVHTLEELAGTRCVINTPTSHSGMNVLRALVAPLANAGRFFRSVQISGAHEHSLRMLTRGDADVAAIDCITYGLLARHRVGATDELRIIHRTRQVPAPPFVTHRSTSERTVAALREALADALPHTGLSLLGIEKLELAEYRPIVEIAQQADVAGYRELSPG